MKTPSNQRFLQQTRRIENIQDVHRPGSGPQDWHMQLLQEFKTFIVFAEQIK
jgi:hypothetical protein